MSFAPVSMKSTGATLAAYRIVRCSGTHEVVQYDTTTATVMPFGVTADETKNLTDAVPVVIAGICRVYFNDSVAAGGLFTSNNAGQAVPFTAITAGSYVVGINIGPKVNTTGTTQEVLFRPYWHIID